MRFSARRSVASRALASVGALVGIAVLCLLAASSSALAASQVVVEFTPAGHTQRFTVPDGVTSLQILVRGGSGGSGFSGGSTGGAGGGGAQVTGTLGVSPGETLAMHVGEAGGNGTAPNGFCLFNFHNDVSQGGAGGGPTPFVSRGGDGGRGDLCGGGGGGGGGAPTRLANQMVLSVLFVQAGGGGGGGGGGGIAGYGGGAGGNGGPGVGSGNGANGAGPGNGLGGARATNRNAAGVDGGNADFSSSAGGGGGGGGGDRYGGGRGTGGVGGAGGGGGGGAGDTFIDSRISHMRYSTGPYGAAGVIIISYTPPTSAIQITRISSNSPSPDTGSNQSLNAEWIRLRNTSQTTEQLRGWSISNADGHTYRFGGLALRPGAPVTVHSGRGRDSASDRYWKHRGYIWNNTRDTARLLRADGTLADQCRYNNADANQHRC
jgi:Lamin Tail Domain